MGVFACALDMRATTARHVCEAGAAAAVDPAAALLGGGLVPRVRGPRVAAEAARCLCGRGRSMHVIINACGRWRKASSMQSLQALQEVTCPVSYCTPSDTAWTGKSSSRRSNQATAEPRRSSRGTLRAARALGRGVLGSFVQARVLPGFYPAHTSPALWPATLLPPRPPQVSTL